MEKKVKQKKCPECGEGFIPFRMGQKTCTGNNFQCAKDYARKKEARDFARETRKKRRELLSGDKGHWKKKAQKEFNKFIRLRDKHEPCIACGKMESNQWHAGHYRTVGAAPGLRFNEDNCNKQCVTCNNFLSGNLLKYKENLIKKIGHEAVSLLESYTDLPGYTVGDYKEIFQKYQKLNKQLER